MRAVKIILSLILAPIYVPLILFIHFTYNGKEPDKSWYHRLILEGNPLGILLYYTLLPIYVIAITLLYFTYGWWQDLTD